MDLKCKNCGRLHKDVSVDYVPEGATSMSSNWCCYCEDDAKDYYNDWFNFNEPEEVDPDQLSLFDQIDSQ